MPAAGCFIVRFGEVAYLWIEGQHGPRFRQEAEMATSTTLSVDPTTTYVLALGGEARAKAAYGADGNRIEGAIAQREASDGTMIDVHTLTGVGVTIGDLGLDDARVSTGTRLDGAIKPGTIFCAEGRVEVSFRAEAKAGYRRGEPPRATLVTSVWVERLSPVGNAFDVLATKAVSAGGAK